MGCEASVSHRRVSARVHTSHVRACMRACVHVCVHVCVRACLKYEVEALPTWSGISSGAVQARMHYGPSYR